MDWKIEFGGGGPYDVSVTTSGDASLEGFLGFNRELVTDWCWRPGMAILIDHSALDATTLSGADADEIAAFLLGLEHRLGHAVCAIVARDAYAHGFLDTAVHFVSSSDYRIRTFPTCELALEWLSAVRVGREA